MPAKAGIQSSLTFDMTVFHEKTAYWIARFRGR
jgi:hypothetical protein